MTEAELEANVERIAEGELGLGGRRAAIREMMAAIIAATPHVGGRAGAR